MLIRIDGRDVNDAERIAEIASGIGEYSQHRHVDAHESDCTTSLLPQHAGDTAGESGGATLVGADGFQHRNARVAGTRNGLRAATGAEKFAKRGLAVVG